VLYHFEFDGLTGWEALGSGRGAGDDPLGEAIGDITGLLAAALPRGDYRCIAASGPDPRWLHFSVGDDGTVGPI
jgi:hypothetical protein